MTVSEIPTRPPEGAVLLDEVPGRGATVGRFVVLARLGTGSAATVLSAYDPSLDRKVALKVLRPDVLRGMSTDAGREDLVREALAMARLSHPNVVAVYELVFDASAGYLVIEHVEGTTLRDWLAARRRGWEELLDTLVAAGAGLAAAHKAGLVHHDFEPENVLVGADGRPRVSKFGFASAGAGTRAYMAPEQIAGEPVDARADQYAFCVTLWEALHGERPGADAAPPRARRAPRWVYHVLARGLAARPDDRWPSMDELLARLRRRRSLGRRGAGAVGGLAIAAVTAFLVGRQGSTAALCAGAEARLAGIWDAARRDAVQAAFAASGLPYADAAWRGASARLDAYARDWVAMHTAACRATRVEGLQSDQLLDLRMACLDRRRAVLGSLTELWARDLTREAVEQATDAAERLPPLAECADARALTERAADPADPALAARVAAARRSVDAARALGLAGRTSEGAKLAAAARVEAEAIGWPLVGAEAALVEGEMRQDLEELRAEPLLLDAARLAAEARDDRLAARALVLLTYQIGELRRAVADGKLVAEIAAGAVARAGADATMRIELLIARGEMHLDAYELPAASAAFTAARTEAIAALGAGHRLAARATNGLVRVTEAQGDLAAARALAERNLEETVAVHGADHPSVARVLANVGLIRYSLKDVDGAASAWRSALAIVEKVEGEGAVAARILSHLGLVELRREHIDEAEALFERAIAVGERAFGPEHPHIAAYLANLAAVRRRQGRYDETIALQRRAMAIDIKINGPDHPNVAMAHFAIGWAQRERDDPQAALESFRRALKINDKALGRDHRTTRWTSAQVAWTLAVLGRCDEARPLIATALGGETDDDGYAALIARGRCELAAGSAGAAVATLQLAVDAANRNAERGRARAPLVLALWAAGRRNDARAAARQAEQELAGAEGASAREHVRAWLATHAR